MEDIWLCRHESTVVRSLKGYSFHTTRAYRRAAATIPATPTMANLPTATAAPAFSGTLEGSDEPPVVPAVPVALGVDTAGVVLLW